MSKSLYQFKFEPENKQVVESILNNAIAEEKYKKNEKTNTFTYGNGWLTGKRRIEYRISDGVLSICIWKVVAPILPMIEMGCCDAKSTYGVILNEGMKSTIKKITHKINESCSLTPMVICETVSDDYFNRIKQDI